ncbi:hypothetical protein EYF80_059519 [Liparis tanakae]|uniref:Uncharacterized protein n=1 Tax=Liparis tanakae TaxID=230148 RepID=A0A4Z2ENK4_9TELE|nr:hypothetical protein EYF80_059519 [Liparis tanakae]
MAFWVLPLLLSNGRVKPAGTTAERLRAVCERKSKLMDAATRLTCDAMCTRLLGDVFCKGSRWRSAEIQ